MMTDTAKTPAREPRPSETEKLAAFRPLAQRSLAHELIARLTADITSGKLAPGARLPTETELIAAAGVSRTVVREAVAALRADGLVVTRQGVGAFVAENARRPFKIAFDDLRSLRDVLDVMELRTGVEIEAAGLAAERATPAELRRITDSYKAIGEAIRRREAAVAEDYAFHCSIAEATGNPQFRSFLEYLGRHIIPRHSIPGGPGPQPGRAYLDACQKEHAQIVSAIRAGAVARARAAMRQHLLSSRKRYRKLAARSGVE